MSRRKEELEPIIPGQVSVYVCGPTVYNYFHIGNARPFVVFDVLRRHLISQGYKVKYVQNFTDIDDKMIRRANEEGITIGELADRFIQAYKEDSAKLGVTPADVHPRATEHIGQIIGLVKKLVDKGAAYESRGDVYFDTAAFPRYGCLCGQNLEELENGARIEIDERKRSPMDFTLWKAQKPGEPAWKSPWGMGRPGWHIECSAMSMHHLGKRFDIHCGGQDLVFPHHENEIAQSEAATGFPVVKYWMHNGFLNIDNQKMSKSAGNFFTVRDILNEFNAESVRLFLLSAHYRSPLNFSREQIQQADATLKRLYEARDRALFLNSHADGAASSAEELAEIAAARQKFTDAMNDDMNTADALSAVFDLVYTLNVSIEKNPTRESLAAWLSAFSFCCGILGVVTKEPDAVPDEVQRLLDERASARKERRFADSDRLRDAMKALGYAVEDTPNGQKVKPI
jgi:cysteinyl-tRNA synthetase